MRYIVLISFTLLISCHPLFCTWEMGYEQLKVEPAKEKIIGKYKLTHSSIEFLVKEGFQMNEYFLTLEADGKFKFVNGPDLIFNPWGDSELKIINKEGIWRVSCDDSYDCMIELEGVCVVPLTQKKGNLAILITIGDGDECQGIVYEKMEDLHTSVNK